MTRLMYDSTTVADIPKHAMMVAGYIDGLYETVASLRKRFPHALVVTITVKGTPGAHVIDCEPGDVTPESAAAWACREINAHRKPTIYCMASQWAQVKRAVAARGITGQVSYWIAHYDNQAVLPKGAVAKQYADPKTSGGHYDKSVVADHWPGVDPEPVAVAFDPLTRPQRRNIRQIIASLRRLLRRQP